MEKRIASTLGYIGSVAAATVAAALMSGNALAEGPIGDHQSFTSSRSRADVQAELRQDRRQITSFASEWELQQHASVQPMSGLTRQQVRTEYIAAREQVRTMTAEHGGSGYFASTPMQAPAATLIASEAR
jgi:hypothetical protein